FVDEFGQLVWPAGCLACRRRASWDFLRAAKLGWTTRLAAALSSFLAARLYSLRSWSGLPALAAAITFLICVLMALLMERWSRRRFSFCRSRFLALLVWGIEWFQVSGFRFQAGGHQAGYSFRRPSQALPRGGLKPETWNLRPRQACCRRVCHSSS